MNAFIQASGTAYAVDDVDRLVVNRPFVEIQRQRPGRPAGDPLETIAVVEASKLAIVTLGVQAQQSPAVPGERLPAANGHRPIRRYGNHVRRDLRGRACEP